MTGSVFVIFRVFLRHDANGFKAQIAAQGGPWGRSLLRAFHLRRGYGGQAGVRETGAADNIEATGLAGRFGGHRPPPQAGDRHAPDRWQSKNRVKIHPPAPPGQKPLAKSGRAGMYGHIAMSKNKVNWSN